MEARRVVAVKLTANSQWCCTFRKRKHPAGNCSICRHHRLRDGWEAGKGLEGREERTWSRSLWRGLLELINRFIWTLTGETLRPLIPRSPAGTLANVNALIKNETGLNTNTSAVVGVQSPPAWMKRAAAARARVITLGFWSFRLQKGRRLLTSYDK